MDDPDCGIPDNRPMHLLIPFAIPVTSGATPVVPQLHLPNLQALLRQLQPGAPDTGSADTLTPPQERVRARAHGIAAADGCIPWAALALAQAGRTTGDDAWAWISPAHWIVGSAHITLVDPAGLDLPESESRALLAAMQPYFEQDGIALQFHDSGRWLARAKIFNHLPCASLERAAGRDISQWMPTEPALRRLQNEMQMLLYTHGVNDQRQARGAVAVNSFWIHGCGKLPTTALLQPQYGLQEIATLRQAAMQQDVQVWQQVWETVDRGPCQQLRELVDTGQPARLTLCGPRNALTFGPSRAGLLQRLRGLVHPMPLSQLWSQL